LGQSVYLWGERYALVRAVVARHGLMARDLRPEPTISAQQVWRSLLSEYVDPWLREHSFRASRGKYWRVSGTFRQEIQARRLRRGSTRFNIPYSIVRTVTHMPSLQLRKVLTQTLADRGASTTIGIGLATSGHIPLVDGETQFLDVLADEPVERPGTIAVELLGKIVAAMDVVAASSDTPRGVVVGHPRWRLDANGRITHVNRSAHAELADDQDARGVVSDEMMPPDAVALAMASERGVVRYAAALRLDHELRSEMGRTPASWRHVFSSPPNSTLVLDLALADPTGDVRVFAIRLLAPLGLVDRRHSVFLWQATWRDVETVDGRRTDAAVAAAWALNAKQAAQKLQVAAEEVTPWSLPAHARPPRDESIDSVWINPSDVDLPIWHQGSQIWWRPPLKWLAGPPRGTVNRLRTGDTSNPAITGYTAAEDTEGLSHGMRTTGSKTLCGLDRSGVRTRSAFFVLGRADACPSCSTAVVSERSE
jgi:hypothetical protein